MIEQIQSNVLQYLDINLTYQTNVEQGKKCEGFGEALFFFSPNPAEVTPLAKHEIERHVVIDSELVRTLATGRRVGLAVPVFARRTGCHEQDVGALGQEERVRTVTPGPETEGRRGVP